MSRPELTLPEELVRSVEEFNRGEWYRCHEILEELWIESRGACRDFYQGLLQIAVALHHWRNGNFAGAVSLLANGKDRLDRTGDCWPALDSRSLMEAAGRFREALLALGPQRMADVDEILIPRISLHVPE